MNIQSNFKVKQNPDEILQKIGFIFSNTQKTCTFVIPDRNMHALMDQEENAKKMKRI